MAFVGPIKGDPIVRTFITERLKAGVSHRQIAGEVKEHLGVKVSQPAILDYYQKIKDSPAFKQGKLELDKKVQKRCEQMLYAQEEGRIELANNLAGALRDLLFDGQGNPTITNSDLPKIDQLMRILNTLHQWQSGFKLRTENTNTVNVSVEQAISEIPDSELRDIRAKLRAITEGGAGV